MDLMCERDYRPDNADDIEEEQNNFLSILAAFKHYRAYSMSRVDKTETYLNTLPGTHQDMLMHYRHHLNKIRHCIDENHQIIRRIIQNVDRLFDNDNQIVPPAVADASGRQARVRAMDLDKVQVTLKQFVRDWSADGADERAQCYAPIIAEVLRHYDPAQRDISDVRVLVPGAGLGRLTYEFARHGFHCEGNEFSLFMLIASNFVLNKCAVPNQYTIYPWVHQFVNHVRRQDQVKAATFPDVSPMLAPPKGTFNMVAGDFVQVYTERDQWDCVATCFFIDCANNVAQFVESIYRILKPGAIWVNLGPLLYHYSDVQFEGSIEPTLEDLLAVIRAFGFEILKNETDVRTKYAQNPRSMQQSEYLSAFFVCRKPLADSADECPAARHAQTTPPPPTTTTATAGYRNGNSTVEAHEQQQPHASSSQETTDEDVAM